LEPLAPSQPPATALRVEDDRTGLGVETLKRAILDNLFYVQGRSRATATMNDYYMALAYTVRDRLLHRWIQSSDALHASPHKTVAYLSAEYLLGPHLGTNLISLGIEKEVSEAVEGLGLALAQLLEQEEEPGLGNGGLGRLAACYMESLATLQIPAIGYGIRYEFGIFDQEIRDGWQVERTDKWLQLGNPWEIARPEMALEVALGGRTEAWRDEKGRYRVRWLPERVVKGIPHDTPILGHRVETVNLLRLWRAEAIESFDFDAFNVGDYYRAVEEKLLSENLTKVLYPNDEPPEGKELRLTQQYFFASCSLQDMIRIQLRSGRDLRSLHESFAVQLNDTHPSIAIPELMRLLVDEHLLGWDEAWAITRRTFAYTNHTVLPEARERWPCQLFGRLLPRHLEIVYEINRRFLDDVRMRFPGDEARVARMSLIDETDGGSVRMAHLACVGSHAINGVAELHTELLKRDVLRDFHEIWPQRFINVTNGITPRRWLRSSNPGLANLVSSRIGERWLSRLEELRRLEPLAEDPDFRHAWRQVKRAAKQALGSFLEQRHGVRMDPDTLLDVQVKRFHEYKRQHLNVLHAITLYRRLKRNPAAAITPRTVLFGGKAAPGYWMAKLIIRLIHGVAEVVNADADVRGRLRVVFFPDFNVKNGQRIYPAADLSEQISTAGKEASGTGNMKFALNGALTIGTLDGANVEIQREVGAENFFLFGLTVQEIAALREQGYRPRDVYESDPELRDAIDLIRDGVFARGDRELFRPLVDSLLQHDPYLVLADYRSYVECQERAGRAFRDADGWARLSILNVARMGRFSSDRAIREYAGRIWGVRPAAGGA
jgi:starch phosphorylase